jgi:hypothetical protein
LKAQGWGTAFNRGTDLLWTYKGSGPKRGLFSADATVATIFDHLWEGCTEAIVTTTDGREDSGYTTEDVNLLLASFLVMGLAPSPSIEDYFVHNPLGILGNQWMQDHFTEHKWHHLHSHVHIDHRDLLHKVRDNCQSAWTLHQHLVVDEMIIPFTGRWKYVQCVKGKPHTTGMQYPFRCTSDMILLWTGLKMYCLADSEYYMYDFWLYEGEESGRSHKPTDIVTDFVDDVKLTHGNLPFVVVADSYYGSLTLAKALQQQNVGYILSCRANTPSIVFSRYLHVGLKQHSWHIMNSRKVSAVSAYDKAKLNLLTNIFDGGIPILSSDGRKRLPQAMYFYRKWLGSVDHFDRMLHLYLFPHRNLKWHQALLPALLKIAVNNTWIIYNNLGNKASLKEVELEVIQHLSGDHTLRVGNTRPGLKRRHDGFGHWPTHDLKRPCAECRNSGTASNTSYSCERCNVHLHPTCMKLYHEK